MSWFPNWLSCWLMIMPATTRWSCFHSHGLLLFHARSKCIKINCKWQNHSHPGRVYTTLNICMTNNFLKLTYLRHPRSLFKHFTCDNLFFVCLFLFLNKQVRSFENWIIPFNSNLESSILTGVL